MKEDFREMLSEFHRRGKEIHTTFIVLMPKVLNPMELCDFRSISLVGCV